MQRSAKRLFVREISCRLTPEEAHARLSAGTSASALLESARVSGSLGRWSVAAAKPAGQFVFHRGRITESFSHSVSSAKASNPFPRLKRLLDKWVVPPDPRLPFAGGAIGTLSYECARYLEPRRPVTHPEGDFPSARFLFFDRAVVFDHILKKTYLVFCAPRDASIRAAEKSLDRTEQSLDLKQPPERVAASGAARRQALFGRPTTITTTLTRQQFIERVLRIKDHIARGDIFQANLAQLISFQAPPDPAAIYARLKRLNPSPFFGMLNAGSEWVLSGSPERLLRLEGRRLDTRPIAGTRPKGMTGAQNKHLSRELFLSPKERAEHVMLVDLERNDLGRVCEPGSVRVDEFMTREEYSHVQHIVSNVEGSLREPLSAADALGAFFPGGTITGAPKIRSMEIIRQMEPSPRGLYTGSLGYFSFSGGMDFNILIRSIFIRNGRATLGAGAGIVADSEPSKEYDETLYKAEAVLQAACGSAAARRYLAAAGVSQR